MESNNREVETEKGVLKEREVYTMNKRIVVLMAAILVVSSLLTAPSVSANASEKSLVFSKASKTETVSEKNVIKPEQMDVITEKQLSTTGRNYLSLPEGTLADFVQQSASSTNYAEIYGSWVDGNHMIFRFFSEESIKSIDIYIRPEGAESFSLFNTVSITACILQLSFQERMDVVAVGKTDDEQCILTDILSFRHVEDGIAETYYDSDGDGLSDGAEIFYVGSDPYAKDTDKDGIGDREAVMPSYSIKGNDAICLETIKIGVFDCPVINSDEDQILIYDFINHSVRLVLRKDNGQWIVQNENDALFKKANADKAMNNGICSIDALLITISEFASETNKIKNNIITMCNTLSEGGNGDANVIISELNTSSQFISTWNASAAKDVVVVNSHGNPTTCIVTTSQINLLYSKSHQELILLGCNCGHYDYLWTNIAVAFTNKIASGARVIASDGTVQSTLSLFTYQKFKSKNDDTYQSLCSDPSRPNKGWVRYYKSSGTYYWGTTGFFTASIPDFIELYLI